MARLKPAEVAIILERIRPKFSSEVDALSAHIDEIGSEDAMLSMVREMVSAVQASTAAEAKTSDILDRWTPTIDALSSTMDRIASAEEGRLELQRTDSDRNHELQKIKLKNIVVPIVTALAGALSAGAAFYFSAGG